MTHEPSTSAVGNRNAKRICEDKTKIQVIIAAPKTATTMAAVFRVTTEKATLGKSWSVRFARHVAQWAG